MSTKVMLEVAMPRAQDKVLLPISAGAISPTRSPASGQIPDTTLAFAALSEKYGGLHIMSFVDDSEERELVSMLSSQQQPLSARKRKSLVFKLGRVGDATSMETVVLLRAFATGDESAPVRAFSVWALKDIGAVPDEKIVEELIDDGDRTVRASAADWVRECGDVSTAEKLLRIVSDGEMSVRCAIAKALGEFNSVALLEGLLSLVEDKDKRVRHFATASLVARGDRTAIPTLEHRLACARGSERRILKIAISRLAESEK